MVLAHKAIGRLWCTLLRSFVRTGNIVFITADGSTVTCGDGSGPEVVMKFTQAAAQVSIMLDPELKLGEAYMDGSLVIEHGTIADALAILMGQAGQSSPRWTRPHAIMRNLLRHLQQFNPRPRSRRNVAHHYDLDGRLYSLFLDSDRQYSCAYFEASEADIGEAQLAKKRHLAAKLLVAPEHRVLDIGCGWGGLAFYLTQVTGANVTGVTLSEEQLRSAIAGAEARQLSGQATFRLQDYRDVSGPFDRIVSVGMFEHVGVNHYDTFFRRCAALMADDGVMVLHSIGRSEGPSYTSPWVDKYIFPGSYIPALSEVLPSIERAGLLVTDIEILRLHYARTLRLWRERFLTRRKEVERFYDQRFVRMWEFYLAASEMAFRKRAMMNFQIQLAKRQDVVPMTRDYIRHVEDDLRSIDGNEETPAVAWSR